jgi:hypothetical protein
MEEIGICLFLPRRHFLAVAPSFVEAALGAPSETPGREAIENATALMRRLAANAAVVPLNLFGNHALGGGLASDQPDFLVDRATLPYIFSLIGGRNWKSGPGVKASPLMTEIWTLLNDGKARTAGEIQAALGRELTEAAVLRGLAELWNGLRVIPAYDGAVTRDGDTTRWELTQARFAAEMTASQKVAQTTALSALVSLYLDGAVAASSEEIETFLSPLTARSRVREVVNGLSATRQLGLVSVGAQPLLHVAGALPEFAEEEAEEKPRDRGERQPPFAHRPRAAEGAAERKPFERRERPQDRRERTGFDRGGRRERTGHGRTGPERTGPPRDRREPARPGPQRYAARGEARDEARNEGRYRPERRPGEGERRSYGKKPYGKSARPFGGRPFDRERPPGGGGKFPPKKFGKGGPKPWQDRSERRAGDGERPFRARQEKEQGGERHPGKFGGAGKQGEQRFSGEFKRERPGEKRPFFRERAGKPESEFRRREPRGAEGERPFRPRREEEHGGERRTGGWKGKPAGGGFSKSGGLGFGKSGKPSFKSSGKPPYKSGGKPGFKSEGGSGFKKAGFGKQGKPFGKSGKPFGKFAGRSGKPSQSKGKPGGFKPPFRKRKKEGDGNGE